MVYVILLTVLLSNLKNDNMMYSSTLQKTVNISLLQAVHILNFLKNF